MPFCPNCDTLKSFLADLHIPMQVRDLEDPDVSVDLMYNGIVPTEAPLLSANGNYYDPSSLFQSGSLNTTFIQTLCTGVESIAGYQY